MDEESQQFQQRKGFSFILSANMYLFTYDEPGGILGAKDREEKIYKVPVFLELTFWWGRDK